MNSQNDLLRDQAIKHIKVRREFTGHLIIYFLVSGVLLAIWAMNGGGYFWPAYPILGWGIGVFFHGWAVSRGEPSEEEIRTEMERLGRHGT